MPYPYDVAYSTKIISGWYGDELHYTIDGRTIGAILPRSAISNSTKQNYIFDQRLQTFGSAPNRGRRRSYFSRRTLDRGLKKYFVVISNLPTIAGPFYYDEAVIHMERILTENA